MPEEEEKKSSSWFLQTMITCSIIAALVSFYFFYFQKDFDFIVETACDPLVEACFQRDCTNPDDCPPNQLSDFKRYTINANDFEMCENEDCKNVCERGAIQCDPIECVEDEEAGEFCISPEEAPTITDE